MFEYIGILALELALDGRRLERQKCRIRNSDTQLCLADSIGVISIIRHVLIATRSMLHPMDVFYSGQGPV